MNISAIRLPQLNQPQRTKLEKLVQFLSNRFNLSLISCFGVRNSTTILQNCFAGEQQTFHTHLNLLIIHETDELTATQVQPYCEKFSDLTFKISITAFSFSEAMKEFAAGDAFLTKAYQHGTVLYKKEHQIPAPHSLKVDPIKELAEIEEYSAQWNAVGRHFLDCARYCLSERKFGMSIFMIHQAIENICKTIIHLLTNYRSKNHNLCWMFKICSTLDIEIAGLFPKDTQRERELFKLLRQSYLGFRYTDSFIVCEQDAWVLFDKALQLHLVGERICGKKLQQARNKTKPVWPFEEIEDPL